MDSLSSLVKEIGAARLAGIVGVTAGVAAVLAWIMLRLGEPPMGLLYSGLELDDAQEIVQRLEQANVPYQLRSGGRAILAPQEQVLSLRMTLSGEGLPAGGVVGYEIFDETEALGANGFQQNVNYLRALEGELARTIRSIDAVRSARVHLVIPERELFSREKRTPSASIVVETGRSGLNAASVRAIQNLVASAVADLAPERVTILDSNGAMLARGVNGEEDADNLAISQLEERTASTENRIRRTVEDIVSRIVGPEAVRVQVSVEMDFSRITEQAEIYDPDGQVVLSTRTVEESASDRETEQAEGVTVANNLPDADQPSEAGPESSSNSSRLEEVVNYEISKTLKSTVHETGEIERLSVAVAVDGKYDTAEDGTETYVPRTEEEMTRITALVRSAIGFDAGRDQLEVINVQFAQAEKIEAEPEAGPFLGLTKDDYMRIAEIAVLGVLGLILILFVLGPFLSAKKGDGAAEALAISSDGIAGQLPSPAAAGADGVPALAGAAPGATPAVAADGTPLVPAGADGVTAALPAPGVNEYQSLIDIAQVQGQVKASSVKKVSEIVEKHPEESLAILRNWLHEG